MATEKNEGTRYTPDSDKRMAARHGTRPSSTAATADAVVPTSHPQNDKLHLSIKINTIIA